MLNTKTALAAAQRTTETDFLCKELLQLNKKQNLLQEEEKHFAVRPSVR